MPHLDRTAPNGRAQPRIQCADNISQTGLPLRPLHPAGGRRVGTEGDCGSARLWRGALTAACQRECAAIDSGAAQARPEGGRSPGSGVQAPTSRLRCPGSDAQAPTSRLRCPSSDAQAPKLPASAALGEGKCGIAGESTHPAWLLHLGRPAPCPSPDGLAPSPPRHQYILWLLATSAAAAATAPPAAAASAAVSPTRHHASDDHTYRP